MSFKRKLRKAKAKVQLNVIQRTCGECTVCCTEIGVSEINKPAGEPCKNLASKGCRIYDERPQACAKYYCAWLAGKGDLEDRPDLSGIMLGVADHKVEDIRALIAHEVKENAFEIREDLLAKLVQDGELLILHKDGKVIGPPEKVERFMIYMDSIPKSFGKSSNRLFG